MAKITSIVVEVTNDEESKEVQDILINSGCSWTNNIKYVKLYYNSDNLPAIYSNYDGRLSHADRDFYARRKGTYPHDYSYTYGEFMAKYGFTETEKLYKALKHLKD